MMIYIVLITVIAAADILIKNGIERRFRMHEEKPVCRGIIRLTRCHNYGMVMGIWQDKRKMLMQTSSFLFLMLVFLFFSELISGKGAFRKLAYSLLIGGSLSNLYDRGTRGYVVDYFRFDGRAPRKFKKIVFNLGDLFIFTGGLLLTCKELLSKK